MAHQQKISLVWGADTLPETSLAIGWCCKLLRQAPGVMAFIQARFNGPETTAIRQCAGAGIVRRVAEVSDGRLWHDDFTGRAATAAPAIPVAATSTNRPTDGLYLPLSCRQTSVDRNLFCRFKPGPPRNRRVYQAAYVMRQGYRRRALEIPIAGYHYLWQMSCCSENATGNFTFFHCMASKYEVWHQRFSHWQIYKRKPSAMKTNFIFGNDCAYLISLMIDNVTAQRTAPPNRIPL